MFSLLAILGLSEMIRYVFDVKWTSSGNDNFFSCTDLIYGSGSFDQSRADIKQPKCST